MTPVFPLWGNDTRQLAEEMLAGGLSAHLTCVDPRKLDRSFAGRRFDANLLADAAGGCRSVRREWRVSHVCERRSDVPRKDSGEGGRNCRAGCVCVRGFSCRGRSVLRLQRHEQSRKSGRGLMQICSLLPSATEILYALGLGDCVAGVTHECDFPPEAAREARFDSPAVDPKAAPAEIDRQVSELVGARRKHLRCRRGTARNAVARSDRDAGPLPRVRCFAGRSGQRR